MLRFDAEIRMLPTAKGGRRGPVRNGYRGIVRVGNLCASGVFDFGLDRWIRPGELVRASVRVVSGDDLMGMLPKNKRFEVTEGLHVVGEGRVIDDSEAVSALDAASIASS